LPLLATIRAELSLGTADASLLEARGIRASAAETS
jgi:hypothetical protein